MTSISANMPTSSATERMIDFARQLDLAQIPAEVVMLARLHLADAIGVALAAASVPAHRSMLTKLRRASPQTGAATVLGFADPAPASVAALINGTSMHSLEYDDTHMGSIVHGSAVIVATVLAVAEEQGLTLDDALRLTIIGWELLVRLGEASPGSFQRRGFQVTSVGGVVVAAILAATARGCDAQQTAHAAGIAGSQGSGIFEFLSNGSKVKALHPGWAAHGAIWAAMLAESGMTGPMTVLEGKHGIFAAYADDTQAGARLSASLTTLGERWALSEAAFKFYPCCHYIHPYLEAAELLRAQVNGVAIVAAHCKVAPGAATVIAEPWSAKQSPRDSNAAKYSLPYTVALALLGQPIDLDAMTGIKINAQAVALAGHVTAEPWMDSGFPARFAADLSVTLADGSVLHHQIAQVLGSAERPASADRVRQKLIDNASRSVPVAACDAIWAGIMEGDTLAALVAGCRQAG
ncbi:MmgE/PrpD family protein [Pigmentiphaga aceris]|uniref:MmgE/PrpD family protein n=1 Tax=Pigmentiphaga aceris TaxID=1940612 RepID=A0A5C0AWG6_9BURK|nr:MmgE/PrpD family protein [Pigmentiphaga aceris]QEI06739.1 MmgE/PrpD family protein [Pigmentiphaga aceris]